MVEAVATGNNALAGAAAGAGGEMAAMVITNILYPNKTTDQLTEAEKQNITFLSQLAGGLASGSVGDSTQAVASGGEIAKRAVENNYLYVDEAKEKMVLERKVRLGEATEEEENRLAQLNLIDKVRDQDIINACQFVSSKTCQELVLKAEYAQYGYEQALSYNTQLKELYPTDYQNVQRILSGKDKDSVEFEKIAIGISQSKNISLDEAKNFLEKAMIYKEVAELVGAVRGGTSVKYGVPMKTVSAPVGYEKVVFNGIELHPNLPPPKAGYDFVVQKAKGNTVYQQWKDINGYRNEINLANNIAETGRTVIKWGNSTGTHGSDIISVNPRTGEVELWDSKYRSRTVNGRESPTFDKPNTRASAIREAIEEIKENKSLSSEIRQKALDNLNKQNFTTYTVGRGKVKSSVIQKYCNNQKCP